MVYGTGQVSINRMMIVKRRQTLIAGLTICCENACCLECVDMTSRWLCWRSEIFFWGLNSIFMQIPPFVSLCKYLRPVSRESRNFSGEIILFTTSKRRRSETRNIAVIANEAADPRGSAVELANHRAVREYRRKISSQHRGLFLTISFHHICARLR